MQSTYNYVILFIATVSAGILAALHLCDVYKFVTDLLNLKKSKLSDYGAVKLTESPSARSWAVVTGASSGIGYQFALQLAKKGFNIFAIARSEDKLKALAEEIMTVTKDMVVCEIFVFDLCTKDDSKWQQLIGKIDSLPTDVGIVVNNAGMNQSYPEFFNLTDERVILDIVNLNIVSVVRFTRALLPQLLKTSKTCKKRLVLNVGSMAGSFPVSLLSTYSGTKSFIATWTEALAKEMSGSNVQFEALAPFFVATKMAKINKPSYLIPSPENYVRYAIDRLGSCVIHSSYPPHSLLFLSASIIPKEVLIYVSHLFCTKIRNFAIKKLKSR